MADLDLDVARDRRTGEVKVLDEDEFAEHRVRYGYPPEVVRQAERAARELREAISAREEPFATTYRTWLAMVERPPPADRERPFDAD